MTTKPLHWQDITTDPLIVRIKDAGADAMARTPLSQKRWNSLTAGAQVVLQLANIAALLLTDVHWGVTVAIAVVVGLAEVVLQARTKTPVTPHVVEQLTQAAGQRVIQERLAQVPVPTPDTSETVPMPPQSSGLPTYDGPTSSSLPYFDRD